ncbi:MAG: dihydrofolate reductase family protein, partial [Anaerolineae bacterium]|nr:dihydrofolate reductase family protein [Anaerolineae bacterium]
AEIRKLKAEDGGDLLVAGSGLLIKTLMEHHLVDDYRLLIYPVVLGAGQKLFMDGVKATLKLVECRDMGSGVVALRYQANTE